MLSVISDLHNDSVPLFLEDTKFHCKVIVISVGFLRCEGIWYCTHLSTRGLIFETM